jgi:hypothetical protein
MYSAFVPPRVTYSAARPVSIAGASPEIPAREGSMMHSMMHKTSPIFLLVLALAIPACGSNGGSDASTTVACQGTNVVANERNNYAFSSTLTFPPIAVAPKTELTLDWGGVTTDFVGHTLDAKKDLNTISILMWNLTLTDLQTKLNSDSLKQSDLTVVPLSVTTDGINTSAKLFNFTLNGNSVTSDQIVPYFDVDIYPPATHTYLLTAATGTILGQGTKMLQSFQLDPNSTNSTVTMTSKSTNLTYQANLHDLAATGIPAGQATITLDWSKMKTNALGNTFTPTSITSALLANYTQTPAELEAKFLDLELIAATLYKTNIDTGTTVDFSSLKDSNGNAFSGIDGTGTWIVALQCGGCRNPAPWYLSILKPCS